ncbi:aminopeptidase N [Nesterenkonia natronophila]|uniref:Aminopeptidase N n=1 Tax=Nesterenkonia natronophila TaxID=2174932 RepID=A0A3A4F7U5_9MICC|nr:aminopeptidase N [Nesterenkonia natronophila]RJN31327.1 aminopeptidase N [Nesterenkonia natronophila]
MSEIANLTRRQAAFRSSCISVSSYTVHVDLSSAAEEGATSYPVTSRTELVFDPASAEGQTGAPFLDYMGESVNSLKINGAERDPAEAAGAAGITLEGLVAGTNVVEIESVSRYSRSGEGLHRFVDPSDGSVYLYTQYEPADCRRVFPVFDQPDIKSRFRFSITGPESWQLRSNAPEVSRRRAGDGVVRVEFAETQLMSSYVTALLAGPYHLVSDSWRGAAPDAEEFSIDLAVLCRASLAEYLDAEEILKITKQGLDFFHREFSYPYPWGKYDQVFVPEYNLGAMENPGLVTFTEKHVFDTGATEAQHETRANTILHEMAHMWFGDLVTMQWWDDLWLKESFADYMGSYAVDAATDFTTAWVAFASSRKGWAYVQDQLPTTHPIVADIPDLEAADQNFDGITYAKGASVLKQLAAYAGAEAFRQAARRYFARFAFGNARLADFLDVLEEATGKDMSHWSAAWLQTSGLPVLSAPWDEAGLVQVHQSGTDPATGQHISRPHVIQIGLFTLDGTGVLSRAQSVPAELSTTAPEGLTPVPGLQLPAQETPRVVLPNDQDLTYAKVVLDAASVDAALTYPIGDALARATVWASLWSMVRDGLLVAERFVDAVLQLGLHIPEVSVVQSLLRQANQACELYTPAGRQEEQEARFSAGLAEFIAAAQPSDARLAATRTLAAVSRRHPSQLDHLQSELLSERDEELRWSYLQALAAHGRVGKEELDAEINRRTSARAGIAHRLALAARPDPEIKEAALQQALAGMDADGVELSNDHLTATVDGFTADPHGVAKGYETQYFDSLTEVWERMSQGQATRVVRGLFPGVQQLDAGQEPTDHPMARRARQWLEENGSAPTALRRIVLEEEDHLLRSLRAQQAAM